MNCTKLKTQNDSFINNKLTQQAEVFGQEEGCLLLYVKGSSQTDACFEMKTKKVLQKHTIQLKTMPLNSKTKGREDYLLLWLAVTWFVTDNG